MPTAARVSSSATAVFGLCAIVASAQAPPTFEVISVKPTTANAMDVGRAMPGGRWTARKITLELLLHAAFPEYRLPGLIAGGPKWISDHGFDIDATAANPKPTPPEYTAMLRQLLADRFSFRSHVERRPVDVYALTRARNGDLGRGLTVASAECIAQLANGQIGAPRGFPLQVSDPKMPRKPCQGAVIRTGNTWHFVGTWPASSILSALQTMMDRKIVDHAALAAVYDLDLEFDSRTIPTFGGLPSAVDDIGTSVFTAVRERLGLRLEASREATEVLVVDSVALPTAN
jgi:uncharacterized protein (TIGR03435 family)